MTNELFISGGTALTLNAKEDIVDNAGIHVKDGRIVSVTREGKAPKGVKVVDAGHCLVMPGIVNGHTHTGMTLLRGIADDLPLHVWLETAIFPLERKFGDPAFVKFGTTLAALEMIRSGTTTANDMYYFEEHAARAFHDAGVRAIAGQSIMEISGVGGQGDQVLAEFERYLDDIKGLERITPAITPHSVYGLTPGLWKKVIDFAEARDLLVHTHLSETAHENAECRKLFSKSPTQVFEEWGLWGRCRSVAAHGVYLDAADIAVLAKHGVGVVHNAESNMKLGNAVCPVADLRAAGVAVALGTDGTASNNNLDMLQEADVAAKLQVTRAGVGKLPAKAVVRMLTIEGARAVGLDKLIGSLEPGKRADIIAVDTRKAHAQPLHEPYSHLVYSAGGADVKHTIVDGRVLMEDYRVKSLDEAAVLNEAAEWGKRIRASR